VPSAKKFAWEHDDYNEEEDEFLKHFDENGNFIETREEPSLEDIEDRDSVKITYRYKENSQE